MGGLHASPGHSLPSPDLETDGFKRVDEHLGELCAKCGGGGS